jgi:hypothetical protein
MANEVEHFTYALETLLLARESKVSEPTMQKAVAALQDALADVVSAAVEKTLTEERRSKDDW